MNPLMNNQIRFSGSQRGVRKIEFQAPCTYSCTYSIYRHTNHVKSNLCGGISNLRGGTSNLRIFDINPATKFEYGGKSNLVAPDPWVRSSLSGLFGVKLLRLFST